MVSALDYTERVQVMYNAEVDSSKYLHLGDSSIARCIQLYFMVGLRAYQILKTHITSDSQYTDPQQSWYLGLKN